MTHALRDIAGEMVVAQRPIRRGPRCEGGTGACGSFGVEPSLIFNEVRHPGVPLGKWLRNTLKEIERDLPSLHVIDVAQTRLGDVAADVIWATRSLAVNLTQVEYLTLTESSGIILLFTCSSADFAALNEQFAQCAQSLETEA